MLRLQRQDLLVLILTLALSSLGAGCALYKDGAGPSQPPIVQASTQKTTASNKPSAQPGVAATEAKDITITVDKSRLLGRQFIYSLDLQHSSQFESGEAVYTQAMVSHHVVAEFRIQGNELQLVSDEKLNFPSDVNHPEKMISRFQILSQTPTTLTISAANSAPHLALAFGSTDDDDDDTGKKKTPVTWNDHWVRSFDFVADGNYFLQQSSIQFTNGVIAEFMESIFPRENLKVGKDYYSLSMDSDAVKRFRLLGTKVINKGDERKSFAMKYDLSPQKDGTPTTIDWYVTPNIPDDMLEPVKLSVEAWNRYFLKYKGIERKVVRFMGRLPEGVHLGDPRYNVIGWDGYLGAGEAYETQAADPETGRQSHSLIYLPAAWLAIGTDYWTNGLASNRFGPEGATAAESKKTGCHQSLRDAAKLIASGRIPEEEIATFGVELLKFTLFHEVGHALGLNHNFKGSLSDDPAKSGSPFTNSVMDYNSYELSRFGFKDVASWDGPIFEYDRQAISLLYNRGDDVSNDDAVILTCADKEADNMSGGVDPLCNRYDEQKDPTNSVTISIDRILKDKIEGDVTLRDAIARMPKLMLSDAQVAEARTEEAATLLSSGFSQALKGTLNFYFITGNTSILNTIETNLKSLLRFSAPLPEGYNEKAMREREFGGVQKALEFVALPPEIRDAVMAAAHEGVERISKAPFVQTLPDASRDKILKKLETKFGATAIKEFEADRDNGLAAMRIKTIMLLTRKKTVPYFLGTLDGTALDYETSIVNLLAQIVSRPDRNPKERVAAALSLSTFKGRRAGNAAIASLRDQLMKERAAAADNTSMEMIEGILIAFGMSAG